MKDTIIYNLELNKSTRLPNMIVTRVPGGWIYETMDGMDRWNSVFVPFNDEFNKNLNK